MAAQSEPPARALSHKACWDIMLTETEAAEDTPSRKDGIAKAIEANLRKNYVQLIQEVCLKFKTNVEVPMIATVYCHRFYAAKSFQRNDRFIVATAALFLAFKVSDICPPIKTVLEVSHMVFSYNKNNKHTMDHTKKMFHDHPDFYQATKKKVLAAERSLLYVIGFNFKPDIPTKIFFPMIAKLKATDEQKMQLRQICMNFANDSLKTTLWLQYPSFELALAFIYVTAKLATIKLEWPSDAQEKDASKEWYEIHGMSFAKMDEISNKLLDLYVNSGTKKRKPAKSGPGGVSSKRRVMPPTPELSASNSAMAKDAERNINSDSSRCDAGQNDKAVPEPASVAAV